MTDINSRTSWTRRLLVLALTAAVAVSVIYLPQSMLTDMATNLGVPASVASIIATTVQAGYAFGILLLVPLGDRVHPRRQVTVQALILAAALVIAALAPEVVSVAIAFLAVGLVANIAQIIIPAASKLSPVDRRGATTSTLVGALLVGIFGGRIVGSLLVQAIGWRWVIVVFAALILLTLPFARRALNAPIDLEGAAGNYGRLLLSTVKLVATRPTLVQSAVIQFFTFATFNSIWTVMVLHLTGPAYGWSVVGAGLIGIVGLVAGFVTPLSGRYVDRLGGLRVAGVFLALLLVSVVVTIFDSKMIVLFGITVFLATWANQSVQSANQNRVLTTNPKSRAQANTLFMFFVFLGGSAGAFLGPRAFAWNGMAGVAEMGTTFLVIASIAWLIAHRWELRNKKTDEAALEAAQ